MKAITYNTYGGPDGLRLSEVAIPEPGAEEIRIRVAAASLNAYDWHQYRGEPWLVRMSMGWKVKEPRVLGADLAGVVDAVGAEVTGFAIGDRVLGCIGLGAVADYAVSRAADFAPLPDGVPWADAAASPMAGFTALQGLRDFAKLAKGERVLVWGASGGVGHCAVQIARALGAERVDAVCSGRNADIMRRLGADEVFDYTAFGDPSAKPIGPYDVILDTVCTAPLRELKQLLSESGRVSTAGALASGRLLGPGRPMMGRVISSKFVGVNHTMVTAHTRTDDLAWLADRLADRTLIPEVQRIYSIEEASQACREIEAGHVAGKLVIDVSAL